MNHVEGRKQMQEILVITGDQREGDVISPNMVRQEVAGEQVCGQV